MEPQNEISMFTYVLMQILYEINNALKECRIGSILLNFGIEIKLIVLDLKLKYFGRNKF